MYLRGLNNMGDPSYDSEEMPYNPGVAAPSGGFFAVGEASTVPVTGGNADWVSLGVQALKTWGQISTADTQSKTAIATAPYTARYGYVPGVSPYSPALISPGAGAMLGNLAPLLLIAAVGLAAYMLIKD